MNLLISVFPSLLTFALWVYHGARLSFWATSIRTLEEIPVIEGMRSLEPKQKLSGTKALFAELKPHSWDFAFRYLFFCFYIFEKEV